MVNGKKRTTNRVARKTRTRVPRAVASYASNEICVGLAVLISDNTSNVTDLMDLMLVHSNDWLLIKNNYSEFRVNKVTIDFSPWCNSPLSSSDVSNGWVAIRDGYYVTPLVTLSSNELARFPNVIPFNNCTPFSLSRKVTSGTWFHGNSTSSSTSDMPKLLYYITLTTVASTNTQRGSMRVRYYMSVRGSQMEN